MVSVKYVHIVARAVGQKSGGFEYVGTGMDVTATRFSVSRNPEDKRPAAQREHCFSGRD